MQLLKLFRFGFKKSTSLFGTRLFCTRLFGTSPPPFTMQLDTPNFQGLFTPELNSVANIFRKYDYELRIAGGAVRDLLMGMAPSDIDFATTATPDEMDAMFEKEGIRTLHKKGREHGTVTCRINDKENFEITTLRIDKVCDGRRAEVEFTTDWFLDANRRDLTVNSLFLGLDGTVYDYFNGIKDLEQRHILFVNDATKRIQEDYLRILRYFRFFGRLAREPNSYDEPTLLAIESNGPGLRNVSGERIWVELKKIVVGNYADSILECMLVRCKLAPFIGLPEKPNFQEMKVVCKRTEGMRPLPMVILAAILDSEEHVIIMDKRLKVSAAERRLAMDIVKLRADVQQCNTASDDSLWWQKAKRLAFDGFKVTPESKLHAMELMKYFGLKKLIDRLEGWQPGTLPVNGYSCAINGVPKGPLMKNALQFLFEKWFESEFELTENELLRVTLPVWIRAHEEEIQKSTAKQRKLAHKS